MSIRKSIRRAAFDGLLSAPAAIQRLAGTPPVIRGQSPAPDVWWACVVMGRLEAKTPRPARLRRDYADACPVLDAPVPDTVTTRDMTVPARDGHAIPVRVYTPNNPSGAGVVYNHGGGFVIGNLDSHHSLCSRLAHDTGAIVVAVDYRLAPEHPFPVPWHDAEDAWNAVHAQAQELGITGTIAIGGDSAGANLAIWVGWHAETAPSAVWALYPPTDAGGSYPSNQDFAKRLVLTEARKRWFRDQVYAPEDLTSRAAQPLKNDPTRPDGVVVPHVVAVAGMDILRDEGEAYIQHLRDHDVPVIGLHLPGQVHGFANLCRFPSCQLAYEDCVEALRPHLRSA